MNKIIKYIALSLVSSVLVFTSCTETADLMTSNVEVGGLVTPTISNVPYKLNATPSFKIGFTVPMGPAVSKVELYKEFTAIFKDIAGKDSLVTSNSALLGSFDVNGVNATDVFNGELTVNYAALINGLQINGSPLPASEGNLNIGEFWTVKFVAVMSDGDRKVVNSKTTVVGVANAYAGTYMCVGYFTHPTPSSSRAINEEKYLTPISATTCNIPVGDLGGSGYFVDITVDPVTNTVTYSNGVPTDVFASVERSYYEPSTGKFYLHYFYVGASGPRIIDEVYTPL